VRLEDSKSHLLQNDLNKEGVRFRIQRSQERGNAAVGQV